MNAKRKTRPGAPADWAPSKDRLALAPWLTLAVSLALSVNGWTWSVARMRAENGVRFEFLVREIEARIEGRMKDYEQVLRGAQGLFAASREVSREEWKAYCDKLALAQNYPGIQGLGFSLRIPAEELQTHIRRVRAEGFPAYAVKPEGERPEYTTIVYLEPFADRNLRAFGYDMFSEPTRRLAMERARDAGASAVSGKVRLVQENDADVQAGFLMYLPVYRNGRPAADAEQRRQALFGYVYMPFRMNDLMRGVLGEEQSHIDLEVFDGEEIGPESLMFDSDRSNRFPDKTPDGLFVHRSRMDIGGHPWGLRFRSLPEFDAKTVDSRQSYLVLAGGLTISFLLFGVMWSLANTRSHALAMAKTMTRSLRESEERFRVMADSAPVLIWISGLDKLCTYFNRKWLEFTGRTLEQEMGNGWVEGVHPDDFARCLETYVSAFDAREEFTMEYRLRRFDGEYRWILDSGTPRREDESFVGYIGSCIDITDRKRAESALRESESRFRAIYEQSQFGIAIVTIEDWRFIAANPAYCKMLGYSEEELKDLTVADVTHPDDIAPEREADRAGGFLIEKRHLHKNGEAVWTSVSVTILTDAMGKPLYRVGMLENVSQRRASEEALRRLNETLEQRVREEVEKNREKDHLLIQQSRYAAMGEMIGNIAHQWRQPLNAVGLILDNILDAHRYNELTEAYLTGQIEHGRRLVGKMSGTVDDFRNFFRPSKEKEAFNALDSVNEAISLVSAGFRNNRIDIELEADEDIRIMGFANEFSHVLLNLFANAKDAIQARRVEKGKVWVRLGKDGAWATLSLRDNGGGIEEAAMERIFEPYFSTKEMGAGIGLYMSRTIIEKNMEGQLSARNVEDGAEFLIRCPLAARE
jgi:PAS domain S-box-containing protein